MENDNVLYVICNIGARQGDYLAPLMFALAIHGEPVGYAIVYMKMRIALNKIENKATQIGLKFSSTKCEDV